MYFGLILTIALYLIMVKINRKIPGALTMPLITTSVLIIAVLLIFDIPLANYNHGANIITGLLGPATVCLAVPMYRHIQTMKKNIWPIIISLVAGTIVSIGVSVGLSTLFGMDDIIIRGAAPMSATLALAAGISEQLGGMIQITIFSVLVTGTTGALIGSQVCKLFRIKNPTAQGLAIGKASHTGGTLRAMEMGEQQGAASSLAMVVSGIMTAIIAPVMFWVIY